VLSLPQHRDSSLQTKENNVTGIIADHQIILTFYVDIRFSANNESNALKNLENLATDTNSVFPH
jgi:hypothetical protein